MEYQLGGVAALLFPSSEVRKKHKKKSKNEKESDKLEISHFPIKVDDNEVTEEPRRRMKKSERNMIDIKEEVPKVEKKKRKLKEYDPGTLNADVLDLKPTKRKSKVNFIETEDKAVHKTFQKTPFPEKSKKIKNEGFVQSDRPTVGKKLVFENLSVEQEIPPKEEGIVTNEERVQNNLAQISRETVFALNAARRIKEKEKKSFESLKYDTRTIFVGNLPSKISKQKVIRKFSKYGPIENARLRCAAVSNLKLPKKVAVVTQEYHSNRTNINAFIRYESETCAIAALAANGLLIDNHHIRVDLVNKSIKEELKNDKAIFVGNLPVTVEEDDLWGAFENCGNIHSVRVIRDRNTAIGKGFGYVNFENESSVELALNLNGVEIKGREARVSRCENIKKKNKNRQLVNLTNVKKKKKRIRSETDEMNVARNEYSGKQVSKKKKPKKKKAGKEELKRKKLVKVFGYK